VPRHPLAENSSTAASRIWSTFAEFVNVVVGIPFPFRRQKLQGARRAAEWGLKLALAVKKE